MSEVPLYNAMSKVWQWFRVMGAGLNAQIGSRLWIENRLWGEATQIPHAGAPLEGFGD